MRIKQLQLIKYGKFDGTSLEFAKSEARAEFDFHVIVGPNEAGKSTVRNAISELLFGMPLRTRLDFRHALTELRLGGTLESGTDNTVFHRARGRTPLRTPADEALPENHLAPFLGTADKAFFEQMFCMDHEQLVEGGKSILDASKDVGRVLFQSAAGIASLGPVREALEKQASSLWAPRKGSSDYAQAVQRYDEASAELKSAQVKTKVWSDTKSALEEALNDIAAEEAKRASLETVRSRLERVRRLAPHLLKLQAHEAELAALGEVTEFPPTAHADLTTGAAELSSAEALLQARAMDVQARTKDSEAVSFDGAMLAFRQDIEALDALRSLCANHPRDLPLRQAEVDRLLEEARAAAVQLGWPADEAGIRASLPTTLALKAVSNLLRDRGAIHQAMRSAEETVQQKTADLLGHEAELQGLQSSEVPLKLRQALDEALPLKNSGARQRTLGAAVDQASARLTHALTALGRWRAPVDALRGMQGPSTTRIAALQRQRHESAAACAHAREKLEESRAEAERLELQATHFEHAHKVVTPTEVHEARANRDTTWTSIKRGDVSVATGAPSLDAAIRLADELVDSQLGTATDAATLQSIRQQLAQAKAGVLRHAQLLADRTAELEQLDQGWSATATAAGWTGMPLDDAADWLDKRAEALEAQEALEQRQRDLDDESSAARKACEALASALKDAAVAVPEEGDLAALCTAASLHVSQADATLARKSGLQQQLAQARRALEGFKANAESAAHQHQAWSLQWSAALQSATLQAASATFAEAEGAVELANLAADRLQKVDDIRRERIDTMRADLAKLEAEARRLGALVEPGLLSLGDWPEVSRRLSQRLQETTSAAQKAALAQTALATAQSQESEAGLRVRTVQAKLKPLLELAGVDSAPAALPLVERSDRQRALRSELAEAREALIQDGDGLAREAIEAEISAHAPTEVMGLLEQARNDLSAVNERLNLLLQKRVTAEQAFSAIAGQANAATAEARRQEALAAMGEVAEQYLEVATAGKLLKWAIDRYRDRKQGPMLQRASAVFFELTLGDFTKLGVDYEKDTPALYARRKGGQVVEVSGLSEGTRDQLYLALRIAALELHLENAKALPFVADDLFINFDDERAKAGLRALRELSKRTQVVFLTHHDHLLPFVREVFSESVNVIELQRESAAEIAG
ncbi:chromosome segregation protein SMC [Variovorax sp. KBW07]|uniref:ATP-binding protein n=1 Tax=Variovorax sp. KBW07 TaxID=2153358 RepID=UPI000F55A57A|nr:YhaN family protein [Variovorax sp. KBW07]RQO58174.1 chromosome segregation protein SMC [Variovorax sp. KBW07]